MERGNDWTIRIARQVGKRVAAYRDKAGLSVTDLSKHCTDLGLPMDRSVISKLENGHRRSVTVDELLVLARALDVPPIMLVFPVGAPGEVEVLPGEHRAAFRAAQWFSGEALFPRPGAEGASAIVTSASAGNAVPMFLYRTADHLAQEEADAWARAQAYRASAAAAATAGEARAYEVAAEAQEDRAHNARQNAERVRADAEAAGILPPRAP